MSRSLMRNRNSGFLFMMILAISIVAVLSYSIILSQTPPPPAVEVKALSISPDNIHTGNQASLSFTLQSDDSKNTRYVTVYFLASPSVTLWTGSSPLPVDQSGTPYFTATLYPSQQSTYVITTTGSLPGQTFSSTYPITVNFFLDGKQFDSKQASLTISS
jgi:hypothetical protein